MNAITGIGATAIATLFFLGVPPWARITIPAAATAATALVALLQAGQVGGEAAKAELEVLQQGRALEALVGVVLQQHQCLTA